MANQEFERKTLEVKFTKASFNEDDEYYYFSGYGAVFDNIDLGNDVIKQGAFSGTLKDMMPKLCYQHDMAQPLGVFTQAKEDAYGLYVEGKMPKDNSQCKDVASLIKCGAIDSMSIGYGISKASYDENTNIRSLNELKLYEVSFVTLPMNPKAKITAFKSEDGAEIKSIRDIENILKNQGGFSAKESKTLISKIKEFSSCDESETQEVKEEKKEERDVASEVLTLLKHDLEASILQDIRNNLITT
jgi:HK97 family phage prohead protease